MQTRLNSHAEASCSARCTSQNSMVGSRPCAVSAGTVSTRSACSPNILLPPPVAASAASNFKACCRSQQPARRHVISAATAAVTAPGQVEMVSVPVPDWSSLDAEGNPSVQWVQMTADELAQQVAKAEHASQQLQHLQQLVTDQRLHRVDLDIPKTAVRSSKLEVPGARVISDPVQLDLVGKGLPVIRGPEWSTAYGGTISALSQRQPVSVPRPHPKFSSSDLQRIADRGPRFSDVVLEHIERMGPDVAMATRYVPYNVLGDWEYEQEPIWAEVPQLSVPELWMGLRARNWTAGKHFNPKATPWRVQFFQCGDDGITMWTGLRALVTQQFPSVQAVKSASHEGYPLQFWVDMPHEGPEAPLGTQQLGDPATAGYNVILSQIYQAYQQKLPKEAQQAADTQGYVAPGSFKYICPGDKYLEVSWHWTHTQVTNPLTRFLINPNLPAAMSWLEKGINNAGIWEWKKLRDQVLFQIGPEPIQWGFEFDPNNAGPLYFLVCLTLGIVVPALRRNRILDIKTLEEDPGAAMEFARSKSAARKEGLTGVEFKDVAGLGPILNEVLEVVEFLKDPKMFSKLGARPPKGILMEGDPGTGKTLLAKALAGEAMVPFYQMAGTEFTEGIVGLGAARVRDLFKRARANAPCVIFVDELDALGLKRAEGDGSGKVNEEREQTLNQLLTEMDGFTPDTGVVFIGATNRADLLDPALMRPGRFDRKIRMPKPDTEGRYEILQLHLRKKQISSDVDLMQISRDLTGLVGADLANIVNEAQMNAVRAGRTVISARDMYGGIDRFTQGERRQALPETHKLPVQVFAAKEAGTVLVAETLRTRHGRIEPVERVSIQPKGRSYSRTLFARGTDEDYQLMTRGRLLDRIRCALAGHIGVRCVLGQETNLSTPDIRRACRMAQKLVFYYSMSEIGITTWASQPYSTDFMLGSQRPRKVVSTDAMDEIADWPTRNEDFRFDPLDPSDPTWHRYTDEVRRVVKMCYEDAWAILETRKDALWALVGALAEQRELLGPEIRDVLDAHPEKPLPPGKKPPTLDNMMIFTDEKDGRDKWPFGIPWLNDAYPIPYWVRQQQEANGHGGQEAAKQPAGSAR